MAQPTSPTILTLDNHALDALVARVTEAKDHGLTLSAEDTKLLLDALMTLASLQERLNDKDITLHKLRKLLGIVRSSEKLRDVLGKTQGKDNEDAPQSNRKKPSRPNKKPPLSKPIKPEVRHHTHANLKKGQDCPECHTGKLYKYSPSSLLRITGNPAFTPVHHVAERLRCNTCGVFFTAELPAEVTNDGNRNQKYGYSARTVMALHKYYAGAPFYRQSSLQTLLGMAISASTVFDQCEYLANDLMALFCCLKRLAAEATHVHIDDTTNRILDQKPIQKKRRNSEKTQTRTGVYSSGLIARLADNREVVLFNTDIGHAGEWLDDILRLRDPAQPIPILMSDALPSNHVTDIPFTKTLCNVHARRQFVDVLSHFPEEVEWVLLQYQKIWDSDEKTHGMSPAQRRDYHHSHSRPIMEEIRAWGNQHLKNETVEANSGLGKAIRYFDNHFEGLSGFCHHDGAALDNNVMEQQIKLVVRNRKNAGFFKSAVGADVGDIITSLIATVAQAGVNCFEYFNVIQRYATEVKAQPERWLPWNYEQALLEEEVTTTPATA